MEAIETKSLNEGWWKELRVRASGKQQGKIFVAYSHSSGAVYYSRTKAEQAGCEDPEPDKRRQPKAKAKNKAKTKAKSQAKRKAKAKANNKPAQDPESADDESNGDQDEDEMASDAD